MFAAAGWRWVVLCIGAAHTDNARRPRWDPRWQSAQGLQLRPEALDQADLPAIVKTIITRSRVPLAAASASRTRRARRSIADSPCKADSRVRSGTASAALAGLVVGVTREVRADQQVSV